MMYQPTYFTDHLDQMDLSILESEYVTSQWEKLETNQVKTVLSLPCDDLIYIDSDFQLIRNDGRLYSEQMSLSELGSYLSAFFDRPNEKPKSEVSFFSILQKLVMSLNDLGYSVYAQRMEHEDSWRIMDDALFFSSLNDHEGKHPFSLFTMVSEADVNYLVNDYGQKVFYQNKDGKYYGQTEEIFYSIYDPLGELLFENILGHKLATIILCIIEGYQVKFINEVFLQYKSKKVQPIEYNGINFVNYITSPKMKISVPYDLYKAQQIVISRNNPKFVGLYYMWCNELEDPCYDFPISPNVYHVRNLHVDKLVLNGEEVAEYMNFFLFGYQQGDVLKNSYRQAQFRLKDCETDEYLFQGYTTYDFMNQFIKEVENRKLVDNNE